MQVRVSHCKVATHGQGLDGCREEGGELVLRLFRGMDSRMVSVGAAEVDGGGTEGGWGQGDFLDGEEEGEERRQRTKRESGEEEQEEGERGRGPRAGDCAVVSFQPAVQVDRPRRQAKTQGWAPSRFGRGHIGSW